MPTVTPPDPHHPHLTNKDIKDRGGQAACLRVAGDSPCPPPPGWVPQLRGQPGGGAHSEPGTRSPRWTEPLGAGSRGPGHQGPDVGGGGAGHSARPSASGRGDTGHHRALLTQAVGTGPATVRMQGCSGSSGRRLTRKQPRPRQDETRLREIHPECWGKGWLETWKERAASQPQLANRWDLPNEWRGDGKGTGGGEGGQGKGRGVHRRLDGTRELLLSWGHGSFWKG